MNNCRKQLSTFKTTCGVRALACEENRCGRSDFSISSVSKCCCKVNQLNDLEDVELLGQSGCQELVFDSTDGLWKNVNRAYESDSSSNIKPCGSFNIVGGGFSTIVGGVVNDISGDKSTGWGTLNEAQNELDTVWGIRNSSNGGKSTVWGSDNSCSGENSSIVGGSNGNINSGANNSCIVGGNNNLILTNTERSVILGCQNLSATNNDTVYMCNLDANGPSIEMSGLPINNGEIVVLDSQNKLAKNLSQNVPVFVDGELSADRTQKLNDLLVILVQLNIVNV